MKKAVPKHHPLVERACAGDESVVPQLRELLCRSEKTVNIAGDLVALSRRSLLESVCRTNLMRREAVLRKMELLRADLVGPQPTPLEQLLVDRILAGRLLLYTL